MREEFLREIGQLIVDQLGDQDAAVG
jgi:hypothetical protein